jgi:hypothetical protein
MNYIRNKGVKLSTIKPSFQMENLNLNFLWKVSVIGIKRNKARDLQS